MNINSVTKTQPYRDIYSFCRYFLQHFGKEQLKNSEVLAEAFRDYFGIRGNPRLSDLINLARGPLGISNISTDTLPPGLHGMFSKLSDKIDVIYKRDDWDGTQEFTIAHEFREIIGVIFEGIDPLFKDVEEEELENEADAFAAALLMEKEQFLVEVLNSGFDPIFLHEKFHKSYIAVISRMAGVLRQQSPPLHFWGEVLEYEEMAPAGFFVAKCFHRSPSYVPKVRYMVPNFFFPKRGQLVPLHGSLQIAFATRRPVSVIKLSGLDFWNIYCLSVIIRPVIWSSNVEKLIIIALPFDKRNMLRKQISLCDPIPIEEKFQRI